MTTLLQWRDTWKGLGAAADDDELFGELIVRYSEPHRKYHTLQHLAECLEHFRELSALAEFPAEIELALWFHDAVYDVARNDNETRSADWARASLLAQSAASAMRVAAQRVHGLIMATRHDAAPAGRDAGILVDADLWILGAPAGRFDEYERQIREEYRHIPDFLFRPKRKALLQKLLRRPRLFSTGIFFARCEPQARANIARSLARLE